MRPTITIVNAGLIVQESHGHWGAGIVAPLPAGSQNAVVTTLNAISCPAHNSCVAVGQFHESLGDEAFVIHQVAGVWGHPKVTELPHWAKSNFITQLDAVSCVAVGYCVAVGQFVTSAPARQAFEVEESKSVWGVGHAVPLPTTKRNPWAGLFGIDCTKWGDCTAVGVYEGTSKGGQGLIETEYKGKWKVGLTAALPPAKASANESSQLLAVSCIGFGTCTAVGQFTDGLIDQGVTMTEAKGHWGGATNVPRPTGAISPPYVGLNGVDCTAATSCVMVGQYQATLGEPALIVTR